MAAPVLEGELAEKTCSGPCVPRLLSGVWAQPEGKSPALVKEGWACSQAG